MRKLRRLAEAAVGWIEGAEESVACILEQVRAQRAAAGSQLQKLANVAGQLARVILNVLAPLAPGLGKRQDQAFERRQVVAVLGRKIGPAVEGLEVGREKDRHGPAAVPCQELHRRHVDLVEIGPLLAI